jgi:FkbM family methyltransferase
MLLRLLIHATPFLPLPLKALMLPRNLTLKRAAAHLLQYPLVGKAVGAVYHDVIPFHGLPIDVRDTGIPQSHKAALYFGMYESAEYRFVRKFLHPDLPVVEIGSSIGAVSSVVASRLAAGGTLVCVEANPTLIPALNRNLKTNARHLSVRVENAALAYGDTHVPFRLSSNNLVSRLATDPADSVVTVPSITLDSLIAPICQRPFQLITDIEGAEIDLLMNEPDVLRNCPLMIMELHTSARNGITNTPQTLKQLITALGHRVVAEYGAVVVCCRP